MQFELSRDVETSWANLTSKWLFSLREENWICLEHSCEFRDASNRLLQSRAIGLPYELSREFLRDVSPGSFYHSDGIDNGLHSGGETR